MSDAKLTAEEACRQVLKTIADACDQESLARAGGYIFRYVQDETVLRDCGQRGVCRTPPGCARHWEERNRELVRENEVLRSNSDHLSSENASLASQVDSMAMRIESLAEELAKPEDVRLREVVEALDGRAVIFDGLGARIGHLLAEMDEWISRAGDAERLADERLAHAHQLQADIEAEMQGRLALRKRLGAREDETMGTGIRDKTLSEVVELLRGMPARGLYRAGGGYHPPSYDDAWRVAALEVKSLMTLPSPPRWTTEPPTEPGWYWAMSRDRYSQPEIVEVIERGGLRALVVDCEGTVDLANLATHWMRIEAPELPK